MFAKNVCLISISASLFFCSNLKVYADEHASSPAPRLSPSPIRSSSSPRSSDPSPSPTPIPQSARVHSEKKPPATKAESASAKVDSDWLDDGLYLVVRESFEKKQVEPLAKNERLRVNDYRFLAPSERERSSFVVLRSEPYIQMLLIAQPSKTKDAKGMPMLQLQLNEDQAKPLEELTRKNVGGRLAIVIDGQIVTIHKIREPITSGRLQITRCTDHGCDAINTALQRNSE